MVRGLFAWKYETKGLKEKVALEEKWSIIRGFSVIGVAPLTGVDGQQYMWLFAETPVKPLVVFWFCCCLNKGNQ